MWFINVLCKLYVRDHDNLAFDFIEKHSVTFDWHKLIDSKTQNIISYNISNSRACSKIYCILWTNKYLIAFRSPKKENILNSCLILSFVPFTHYFHFYILLARILNSFYIFVQKCAKIPIAPFVWLVVRLLFIAHSVECLSFLPRSPITDFSSFNAKLNCLQQLFNYILRLLCLWMLSRLFIYLKKKKKKTKKKLLIEIRIAFHCAYDRITASASYQEFKYLLTELIGIVLLLLLSLLVSSLEVKNI